MRKMPDLGKPEAMIKVRMHGYEDPLTEKELSYTILIEGELRSLDYYINTLLDVVSLKQPSILSGDVIFSWCVLSNKGTPTAHVVQRSYPFTEFSTLSKFINKKLVRSREKEIINA